MYQPPLYGDGNIGGNIGVPPPPPAYGVAVGPDYYRGPPINPPPHRCVGFGPATGPGTGGIDVYRNRFDPSGQFLPGGQVTIDMAFDVIGFNQADKERLLVEFPTFRSFLGLDDDDIEKLASARARAPVAQRISMSVQHKKLLKGLLHWVHDQARVNRIPESTHVLHVGMFEFVFVLTRTHNMTRLMIIGLSLLSSPLSLVMNISLMQAASTTLSSHVYKTMRYYGYALLVVAATMVAKT
jgi:hypothetical protein